VQSDVSDLWSGAERDSATAHRLKMPANGAPGVMGARPFFRARRKLAPAMEIGAMPRPPR